MSVNVFSTKVLIEELFLRLLKETAGRRRGRPNHANFQPSFLSYFKTLCIRQGPETSRSADKRSTDWANPAAVPNFFCFESLMYANVYFQICSFHYGVP